MSISKKLSSIFQIIFPGNDYVPSTEFIVSSLMDSELNDLEAILGDYSINPDIFKRSELLLDLSRFLGQHKYRLFILRITEIYFGNEIVHNFLYNLDSTLSNSSRKLNISPLILTKLN